MFSLQDEEIGGFILQQNVGGHPVAVFRFPARTKLKSKGVVTVWSGLNDPIKHQPPSDFVWREQLTWGTGPECTTIVCKPNGQVRVLYIMLLCVSLMEIVHFCYQK